MSISIIYVSAVPELFSVAYPSFNKATTADANTRNIPVVQRWHYYRLEPNLNDTQWLSMDKSRLIRVTSPLCLPEFGTGINDAKLRTQALSKHVLSLVGKYRGKIWSRQSPVGRLIDREVIFPRSSIAQNRGFTRGLVAIERFLILMI